MIEDLKGWFLQRRLDFVLRRISTLEEAVRGTDETVYHELVQEYRADLQRLNFKRLNLLNRLERA